MGTENGTTAQATAAFAIPGIVDGMTAVKTPPQTVKLPHSSISHPIMVSNTTERGTVKQSPTQRHAVPKQPSATTNGFGSTNATEGTSTQATEPPHSSITRNIVDEKATKRRAIAQGALVNPSSSLGSQGAGASIGTSTQGGKRAKISSTQQSVSTPIRKWSQPSATNGFGATKRAPSQPSSNANSQVSTSFQPVLTSTTETSRQKLGPATII